MNSRCTNDERGAALVISLIMVVLIAGLMVSYLLVSTSNLSLSVTSHEANQALCVAETGLARATHLLNVKDFAAFEDSAGSPAPESGTGTAYSHAGEPIKFTLKTVATDPARVTTGMDEGWYPLKGYSGTYTKTLQLTGGEKTVNVGDYFVQLEVLAVNAAEGNTPSVVRLRSAGECFGDLIQSKSTVGTDTQYLSMRRGVEVVLLYDTDAGVNHAILVDGDLFVNGNILVTGDVHCNGDATARGNAGDILPADGTLSDLTNPPYDGAFEGNFTASGTITGSFNVSGTQEAGIDPVKIPHFTPEVALALAQKNGWEISVRNPAETPGYTERWNGNNNDNADLCPSAGFPGKLIWVNGDVRITGQTQGNVIVIATGNIDIAGGVDFGGDPGVDGLGSHLMLMALGNVNIQGNSEVDGIVYAEGTVSGNGNPTINGSLISNNDATCDFGGSITINYIRFHDDLEDLLKKWRIVSWREISASDF